MYLRILELVVEQSHAGKGHDHTVFVALLDNQIVPDGAAGLGDVLDTGGLGPLDVVGAGEEGIGTQRHATFDGVALGSDAFFPFPDNIKWVKVFGVKYIAQPGGSIRDDLVIEECDKNGMVMAFTGMRLFHH